eukprot:CAMPEP_0202341602 /NCGR_PEP_ID=MMETSP1126-20121109/2526_1 /ASSEMBLY_ACC=CAM_ASM_000457 /TAXON_ID=3047 /ORGANISM="Dunaliella tertiolecta, Strain CCMP1320" /LENGTH=385 /DNA_ID=CAMNT_0048932441 /DNA_START=23 /DNA_END=1180 /DNA_ORIENTATION=+
MKLTFRTVSGETFSNEFEAASSVGSVKDKVCEERGLSKDTMKLVYKGKVLDKDALNLTEAGLSEDGFIVVFAPKPKPAAQAAPAAAAPAPTPAAPAPQAPPPAAPAAATPTPAQPAAATASPAATPAAAADSGLLSGGALEGAINSICEMGFEREQVVRAMRAAFNNPERAVEYLTSGVPLPEVRAPPAAAGGAGGGAGIPNLAAALQGQQAAAGGGGGGGGAAAAPPPGPQAQPFNMFAPPPSGGAQQGAAPSPLDFLRTRPEFQLLRQAVQGNPNILVPMLQELGKSNPQMLQLINSHQAEFLQLLEAEGDEGDEGLEDALGAMGAGGDMPGTTTIQLTQEEADAIGRLEALGFDRASCLEAYLACDKNEELAANYLAENMFD